MKLDSTYTTLKINLIYIKLLHVKPQTVKLPEENGESFFAWVLTMDFLDMAPKVLAREAKMNNITV